MPATRGKPTSCCALVATMIGPRSRMPSTCSTPTPWSRSAPRPLRELATEEEQHTRYNIPPNGHRQTGPSPTCRTPPSHGMSGFATTTPLRCSPNRPLPTPVMTPSSRSSLHVTWWVASTPIERTDRSWPKLSKLAATTSAARARARAEIEEQAVVGRKERARAVSPQARTEPEAAFPCRS